jgi:hypothetical protein
VGVPRQTRGCPVYPWCTGHASAPRTAQTEHHGVPQVIPGRGGRELRLVLLALGDGPPHVAVEVVMAAGGPPLEVVDLEREAVGEAGRAFVRLAEELSAGGHFQTRT